MDYPEQQIFKIVLTGPESTGKTALSESLAKALETVCVPEFARYYVANLGRSYERTDLLRIGRGQLAWERWYARHARQFLVCDTDWTVLQVWEHYRFGIPQTGSWEWQAGYGSPQIADLYLLCTPDFPWAPDPLREHPDARDDLFNWYEKLFTDTGCRMLQLSGSHEDRLQTALAYIRNLFRPL